MTNSRKIVVGIDGSEGAKRHFVGLFQKPNYVVQPLR
jgi:hypothetical protein